MNTRQLTQGLLPAPEFEKRHTYYTFRQFPELRMAIKDVEAMPLRCPPGTNPQSHSQGFRRKVRLTTTHKLDELSKSSLDEMSEVSAMSDFRKMMIENRRKNNPFQKSVSNSASSSQLGPRSPSSSTVALGQGGSPSDRNDVRSANSTNSAERSTQVGSSGDSRIKLDDDLSLSQSQTRSGSMAMSQEELVRSADAKLRKHSISFDARSMNCDISGFQGALSKKELDTQLRRCLNINLRRKELDALFAKMDADGSEYIDGVEFIRYFFQLGIEARWESHMERVRRLARQAEAEKRRKAEDEARNKAWEAAQVAEAFTDEDRASAMAKLADAAFRWDPGNHIECLYISGFEAHLTPFQFKMQIDKSFGLKLTREELAALIGEFKTREGENCIDGTLFLIRFSALRTRAVKDYMKAQETNRRAKERMLQEGLNGMEFYLDRSLGR